MFVPLCGGDCEQLVIDFGLPVRLRVVLKLHQPLETIGLGEERGVDGALPTVGVTHAQTIDDVRDGGKKRAEVLVMIQVHLQHTVVVRGGIGGRSRRSPQCRRGG